MKDNPTTGESRPYRLREAYRRQLGDIGVLVEGSLSKVRRRGRKAVSWQLTFKQGGTTRTVYVPVELVAEVQQWTREFKRLKVLVRKITRQSLAIIRRHGAVRRAASQARLRSLKPSGGNCSRSSATVSRR
jgi:hypothetical protein